MNLKIRRFTHRLGWLIAPALLVTPPAMAANLTVSVLDKEGNPAADAVVVVVLNANAGAKTSPVTITTITTVAQEKMQFIPSVSVVNVGSTVRFANNDPWDHHVRGTAAGFAAFNAVGGFELRLDGKPAGKPANSATVVLDKAGAVQLGCHLHSSMRGYIYVTDSPYTVKTGADGVAQFTDIPEGAATLKVWHADQLIDVAPQTTYLGTPAAKAGFQLSVVPRRRRI